MKVGIRGRRGAWAAAIVAALAGRLAPAAEAKVKPRSLSDSQAAILDHGFKVKVANKGRTARRVRVKVKSRTFDDPGGRSW